MLLVGKINDATRANMLAAAQKEDLDAIAARYNIQRLVLSPGDPEAIPPIPMVQEDDEALRRRIQLAFDGLNTAGSLDSYIFHAMSADGRVRDAVAKARTDRDRTPCSATKAPAPPRRACSPPCAVFGLSLTAPSNRNQPGPSARRPGNHPVGAFTLPD